MNSPFIRRYALLALEGNVRVLEFLLRDLDAASPRWDARPDPERFTLREVVAHLREFDGVNMTRFERMLSEEKPALENWDEGEAALHYSGLDPKQQIAQLQESRRAMLALLQSLALPQWQRTATRPMVGEFSVQDAVTLLLAHDAYHLEQAVEWLEKPSG